MIAKTLGERFSTVCKGALILVSPKGDRAVLRVKCVTCGRIYDNEFHGVRCKECVPDAQEE